MSFGLSCLEKVQRRGCRPPSSDRCQKTRGADPSLLGDNVGVSLTVNVGFLQQNNVVLVHTKPFKDIFIRFLLSQKPFTLMEILFKGFILMRGVGGTTLQFYDLKFPALTSPVGHRSPSSALSGHNLRHRLSFRHIVLRAPISQGTVITPTPRLGVREMLHLLRKRVLARDTAHPHPWEGWSTWPLWTGLSAFSSTWTDTEGLTLTLLVFELFTADLLLAFEPGSEGGWGGSRKEVLGTLVD